MTPVRTAAKRTVRLVSEQADALRFIYETEAWLARMESAARAAQIAFAPDAEIEAMLHAAYAE